MTKEDKYRPFIYVMLHLILWRIEKYEKSLRGKDKVSSIGLNRFNMLNDIGTTITKRKLFFIINANGGQENLFSVFDNFAIDQHGLFELDIPSGLKYEGMVFEYGKVNLGSGKDLHHLKDCFINLRPAIAKLSPNFCKGIDRAIEYLKKNHTQFVTDSLIDVTREYAKLTLLKQYRSTSDRFRKAISIEPSILKLISSKYSPGQNPDKEPDPEPVVDPNRVVISDISPTAKGVSNFDDFKRRIERKKPKIK